ncbi:MAG: type I DNA topoisomerase [Deltaproteobacteria bacterium]|jgi:DNA topoisomerase-1|nr:type I DNA topoisomerase [Deltaproteobacteria bacterium]
MKLLIVESPGKIKKLRSILRDDWVVAASVGHVRDLPLRDKGVHPPDFRPLYVETERGKRVIEDLRRMAAKAEDVYLATDRDREGESIAWHISEALDLKNPLRVSYTEITETAVRKAVESPGPIDMNLVRAQEGRRVLDRIYGYTVSPALSAVAGENLSAGRVQSPALRLVVERERAVRAFVPVTHYGVELFFGKAGEAEAERDEEEKEDPKGGKDGGSGNDPETGKDDAGERARGEWKAVWNPKNFLPPDEERVLDRSLAEKALGNNELTVASYRESERRVPPPPPFITSTLQQAASNAMKLDPDHAMRLAQSLYEAGFITYMRTDNPAMAAEAVKEIRSLAEEKGWPLPLKPREFASREGSQEAHEAIRPTKIKLETAGASPDEEALYALIRRRALASQLEDAVYAVTKAVLVREIDGKTASYEAQGKRLLSPGWKDLTPGDQSQDDGDKDSEPENPVPLLEKGGKISPVRSLLKTKKTSAPQRYTQASLIRELEKRGIGRPSTYAAIMKNIMSRGYAQADPKRRLAATPRGEKLVDHLAGRFAFLEYDFTKGLESRLDGIASGKEEYLPVVALANAVLEKELESFVAKSSGALALCPRCRGPLRRLKKDPAGGLSGYNYWKCLDPACGSLYDDKEGKPDPESHRASFLTDRLCPVCQSPLRRLLKEPKEGSRGYNFWRCSKETCMTTFNDQGGEPALPRENGNGAPQSGHACLKCGKPLKHMVRAKSAEHQGYDFWVCSDSACNSFYDNQDGKPDPATLRQSIPSALTCPECGGNLRHHIKEDGASGAGYNYWRCGTCKAAYSDREGGPDYDRRYVNASDVPCPACGKPLRHLKRETGDPSGDYNYWRCTDELCGSVFADLDGAPDPESSRRSILSEHLCPQCQSKLRHLQRPEGKLGSAYNYWTCSSRDCGRRFEDRDGSPDFENFSLNQKTQHLCPDCGSSLRHLKAGGGVGKSYNYWKCPEDSCGNFFDDREDSPDFSTARKSILTDKTCPECSSKLYHRTKENTRLEPGYNYWICSNRECRASYSDVNGEPAKERRAKAELSLEHMCPVCGKPLRHMVKAGDENGPGYDFWGCSGFPECRVTFNNQDGKPGLRTGEQEPPSTEHMCPVCGKPLRHKVKVGDAMSSGYDFWGCTGFPACRVALNDLDGKPDYASKKNEEVSGFKCPKCQSDLIRRKGVSSRTGYDYDFFSCVNRSCRATFDAVDGKPMERG